MGREHFIWYELLTSEPDAAERFYGSVVGLTRQPSGHDGYCLFAASDVAVAGMMKAPDGVAPAWLGYVAVEDADRAAAEVKAAGGAVHMPPKNIAGVGRFALVADPQGAAFYVMKPQGDRPSTSFAPGRPGHGGWHELHARDWQRAFPFYRSLFGWATAEAMDMGPMGTYQLFAAEEGGEPVGAMFDSPNMPRPAWLFYFNVTGIDQAIDRIRAGGGEVLHGPHEVPGSDFIVQATDPQGAMFALVGPRG